MALAEPLSAESAVTDLDLIGRIRGGDQTALDELYRRYSSPVYSLVWKILQNAEESEDVALDVFWQIWRQAERYDLSRGAPPAWIFTLARSRAIDRLRARHRREDRTVSFDDPELNLDPLDEKKAPDEVASRVCRNEATSSGGFFSSSGARLSSGSSNEMVRSSRR